MGKDYRKLFEFQKPWTDPTTAGGSETGSKEQSCGDVGPGHQHLQGLLQTRGLIPRTAAMCTSCHNTTRVWFAEPKHQGLQPFLKINLFPNPASSPAHSNDHRQGMGALLRPCTASTAPLLHCTPVGLRRKHSTAGGYKTRLRSCISQMYSHLCEADWRQERVGELAAL